VTGLALFRRLRGLGGGTVWLGPLPAGAMIIGFANATAFRASSLPKACESTRLTVSISDSEVLISKRSPWASFATRHVAHGHVAEPIGQPLSHRFRILRLIEQRLHGNAAREVDVEQALAANEGETIATTVMRMDAVRQ